MTFVSPLDLKEIFVGTFSGSWMIFFFIMFIVIGIMAARFKMNNALLLIMFVLFAVFMAAWAEWLYIIAIILFAVFIWIVIPKPFKN